ncbi:hypothetical protein ASG51_16915 [Methylobacterium sp. Leaf465]|nr:hypothetical protein ASG51_16915 [Methylobacterium sp. Leaf465]
MQTSAPPRATAMRRPVVVRSTGSRRVVLRKPMPLARQPHPGEGQRLGHGGPAEPERFASGHGPGEPQDGGVEGQGCRREDADGRSSGRVSQRASAATRSVRVLGRAPSDRTTAEATESSRTPWPAVRTRSGG